MSLKWLYRRYLSGIESMPRRAGMQTKSFASSLFINMDNNPRFDADAALAQINKGAKKIVILHYDSRMVDGLELMQRLYKHYKIAVNESQIQGSAGDVLEVMLEGERA